MSQISQLKENPENNVNLIDVLQIMFPDKKTKYYELFSRLIKYEMDKTKGSHPNLTFFQRVVMDGLLKTLNQSSQSTLNRFIDYNERNLIVRNDLSTYKSFLDITNEVTNADRVEELKKLESEVIKLLDDEHWLVIRPLTYDASAKYGAGTKWCTTTTGNRSYFERYSKGILIYCIHKKTSLKCAFSKEKGSKLTVWDSSDNNLDSLETGLPDYVLKVLLDEIKNNTKSNETLKLEKDKKNKVVEPPSSKKGKSPYGFFDGVTDDYITIDNDRSMESRIGISEETYRRAMSLIRKQNI